MKTFLLILFCTSAALGQINGIYDHPFPRTMAYTMERIGRPEYAAKFDIAIMDPGDSNVAKQIHAINPHTYCLPTRNWIQGAIFWKFSHDTTTIPEAWKTRTSAGDLVDSGDLPYPEYNVTPYCGRYSGVVCGFPVGMAAGLSQGETYGEALARLIVKAWNPDVWDGYASDGTWKTPGGGDADVERNGTNAYAVHGSAWVDSTWQAGWNRIYRDIRAALGGRNRLLLYHSVWDTMGLSWTNGVGLENGMTHSPGTISGWKSYVDQFDAAKSFQPRASWVEETIKYDSLHAPPRKHDYFRYVRWSLGYVTMTDAYYNMGDLTIPGYSEHLWTPYYDEFDLSLGQATGRAQQIGSTGVWVRFFDNGCVIVNTSNITRTVTDGDIRSLSGYAGGYYRFKGNQDPAWNDGSVFSTATLTSTVQSWPGRTQNVGDALFLVKTPTTIVSDIIVDNAYSATSPGSAPTDFSGTWSWDGAQGYPNSTWEITDGQTYGYPDSYYHLIAPGGTGSSAATSTPAINVSGQYKIYEWHGVRNGAATNVPCTIYQGGSTDSKVIDQRINTGRWNLLGTYALNSGGTAKIVLTNDANGYVLGDAFKFVFVGQTPAPPSVPTPNRPPNGAIDQPRNLIFKWRKAESAEFYRFQLASNPSFLVSSLILDDSFLADTLKYVTGLSHGTQYFWRVNARNSYGSSGWSAMLNLSTASPSSIVTGKVFFDGNNNRVKDAGEPGLPGWIIHLQGSALPPVVTDSAGMYRFEHLSDGSYTLSEEYRYGWAETLPLGPPTYPIIISSDTVIAARDFGNAASNVISTAVRKGWNMISVPAEVPDMRKSTLFPSASSGASSYDIGYVLADTMLTGVGYWMRFPQNQILRMAGGGLTSDTIDVGEGWNLIGSIGIPISSGILKTLPDGIIVSSIWGYDRGFVSVDSLLPGLGYWVKTTPPGKIILSGSSSSLEKNRHVALDFNGMNSLTFALKSGERQKLFFSSLLDFSETSRYALPPGAPTGSFDVRFFPQGGDSYGSVIANFSGSSANGTDVPLRMKSASYPLTLSWDMASDDRRRYSLRLKDREVSLGGHGQIVLGDSLASDDENSAVLMLRAQDEQPSGSPSEIELFPNYPNPFNSTTSIRFNLPRDGEVRLNVYNILGQHVRSLVHGSMKAGSHNVSFDALDLPSGIYVYRLEVENSPNLHIMELNRMLLMR